MVVTRLLQPCLFHMGISILNFHVCYADGGAPLGVGVASQFPRKRGETEHQYDHLVKNVKKKDGQRKKDEGEMDHDYHELEGPGDDYDYPEEKERDIVYHVLDGPTPIETEPKTFQNRPNKAYPGELQKTNLVILLVQCIHHNNILS